MSVRARRPKLQLVRPTRDDRLCEGEVCMRRPPDRRPYASIHATGPAPLPHGSWCGACVPDVHIEPVERWTMLRQAEARRNAPEWAKRPPGFWHKENRCPELERLCAQSRDAVRTATEAFLRSPEGCAFLGEKPSTDGPQGDLLAAAPPCLEGQPLK